MLYAMTSPSFQRALRTGRLSNIKDYRKASMLAERSFIANELVEAYMRLTPEEKQAFSRKVWRDVLTAFGIE